MVWYCCDGVIIYSCSEWYGVVIVVVVFSFTAVVNGMELLLL